MALPPLVLGTGVLWADGFEGKLTIGQFLVYENNSGSGNNDDEGLSSSTDLGLTLSSKTRTQSFSFQASGGLRYNFNGGDDAFELDTPRTTLSYAIENRSSRLSFRGSYRRSDIDDNTFLEDPLDPNSEIINGSGDVARLSLTTRLELGRDRPLGAELSYTKGETRYSGTLDPSFVDTETDELDARLRFDINPQMTAFLFTRSSEVDAAGPGSSDRDTQTTGVGLNYQISPILRAEAELGYTEIETDDNAGTVTSQDGIDASFALVRDMPNGTLSFRLSEEETVNGKRRQAFVSRAMEFPWGNIDLSIGATKTDGLSVEPLISATGSYQIDKLSELTLALTQQSNVNDDNEESINTRLSLGYTRQLTELSSLSAQLTVVDRNAQDSANEDQTSTQFRLSHRYGLGRDLDLVSSYRYSKTRADNAADSSDTVISLGLEKTFNFRP